MQPPPMASKPAPRTSDSSRNNNITTETPSPPIALPTTFVSSVEEFQAVFTNHHSTAGDGSDAFLLCYEQPADQITSDGLRQFEQRVEAAAQEHHTRLRLYLWDCTSSAFAAAKAQLGKQPGHPLLLIVYQGAIADTVRDTSLTDMTATEVAKLCSRLASFQHSAKPARVVKAPLSSAGTSATQPGQQPSPPQGEEHLSVDVAKMVGMGKKLMAERKPFYAEKFFAKALQSLDALAADVDRLLSAREDYDGSVALCLAWAGMAQLVQAKHTVDNPYLTRLCQADALRRFREEPLSETCRAVVTWKLMEAAPRAWEEATCSEKTLRAALQAEPQDAATRSMLVVTLFLSGDVERALTEALKLHVCGAPFGRLALKQMSVFLGSDHALVKQLGIPAVLEARAA